MQVMLRHGLLGAKLVAYHQARWGSNVWLALAKKIIRVFHIIINSIISLSYLIIVI